MRNKISENLIYRNNCEKNSRNLQRSVFLYTSLHSKNNDNID